MAEFQNVLERGVWHFEFGEFEKFNTQVESLRGPGMISSLRMRPRLTSGAALGSVAVAGNGVLQNTFSLCTCRVGWLQLCTARA